MNTVLFLLGYTITGAVSAGVALVIAWLLLHGVLRSMLRGASQA